MSSIDDVARMMHKSAVAEHGTDAKTLERCREMLVQWISGKSSMRYIDEFWSDCAQEIRALINRERAGEKGEDELTLARAEINRLRNALIRVIEPTRLPAKGSLSGALKAVRDIARAALEGK